MILIIALVISSNRLTSSWFALSGSGEPARRWKYQFGTRGRKSLKYSTVVTTWTFLWHRLTKFNFPVYPTISAIEPIGRTRSITATRVSIFSLPRHMAIFAHKDDVPVPPLALRKTSKIPRFPGAVDSSLNNRGISSKS